MTLQSPRNGASQKSYSVLIVEDNDDGRFMMRTFLQLKGHRVREARDGMEALAAVTSERPDLILMDLQLPRMDGIAVTRHLRMQSDSRSIPIVILSGWDPRRYRTEAVAAGCDEYLAKPVDFSLLDNILHRYLQQLPVSIAATPSGDLDPGFKQVAESL